MIETKKAVFEQRYLLLVKALTGFYRAGSQTGLNGYSKSALARVWKAERFSWWFTNLMHRFPGTDAFGRKMQIAELDYLRRSKIGGAAVAENYVGLPF
jgi:p-hydroxybenzoate 3-monooxygenase